MEAACLDFFCSERRDYRGDGRVIEDRLKQPVWLEQFLTRWNLHIGSVPDQRVLEELSKLRSQLRRIVEHLNAGQHLSDEEIALLNDYLQAISFRHRLSRQENTYVLQEDALVKDWRWVQAEIVVSFVEVVSQSEPSRIKICENQQCRWIYYDESRGHSRRWCSPICANIMRVRHFRERQRNQNRQQDNIRQ
ncbi:CGNR zinc finger domain-containing protein [Ktedonospora formicarum]|uniref:Zinc finger CGNR domain-containing protein n=1 Tax=Ktedonospora formicarum TaxID=2778364 RepID=A0A8J3IBW5_9CHLR|nr:CGNR zinc finger domain-containing protein [Ktedonospora formicarum]GHO50445.1 hypothetical protein KSX_86080 [Ktedonospora formicarum]